MRKMDLLSACLCVAAILCVVCLSASAQDGERPETGTFIRDWERNGYGVLVVENNNPVEDNDTRDAVAMLIDDNDTPILAVYVREGESFEINGIEDGVYDFYFTVGDDWDDESASFSEPEFYRTDSPLPFETEENETQVLYSQWTISLMEVPGGNVDKVTVPEDEFPDLTET
ncbi:MAG TPA: hypothetical protein PLZ42_07075 [Methanothrix sp.]|mgnify:CR=1 FL=1|nr:hypothetical protein [Methanothrix sp.]